MIRARQLPGKPGFVVTYRHPKVELRHPFKAKGPRLVSCGLGTTVQLEADAYARDLDRLSNAPDDWQDPKKCLRKYERPACAAFFGREHPALSALPDRPTLDPVDVGKLPGKILRVLALAAHDNKNSVEALEDFLAEYESDRLRDTLTERDKALRALKEAEAKIADMQEDLARLRRAQNLHVNQKVGNAWKEFKKDNAYTALAPKTQNEVAAAVESFLASLPDRTAFKLANLRGAHISDWLSALRSKKTDEEGNALELSAVTKAKVKRYVSIFITECYRKYDMAENPMKKTAPVKGAALSRGNITAMRSDQLKDFQTMLSTLARVDDYWHALVSTATLAGPRYAELCWLRLEHVNLESNYLAIATRQNGEEKQGTKTGSERRVPIESTTLRKILAAHLARRRKEQKRRGATEAERSPWLFPSTVEPNVFKPREKAPAGMWSDNGVFLRAWGKVAKKCEAITKPRDYWKFGPREWRHQAGTCMGYSGNDTKRISDWLGNSEDVCRDHYARASEKGKKWPFKW